MTAWSYGLIERKVQSITGGLSFHSVRDFRFIWPYVEIPVEGCSAEELHQPFVEPPSTFSPRRVRTFVSDDSSTVEAHIEISRRAEEVIMSASMDKTCGMKFEMSAIAVNISIMSSASTFGQPVLSGPVHPVHIAVRWRIDCAASLHAPVLIWCWTRRRRIASSSILFNSTLKSKFGIGVSPETQRSKNIYFSRYDTHYGIMR
jgi:hypothetical protein